MSFRSGLYDLLISEHCEEQLADLAEGLTPERSHLRPAEAADCLPSTSVGWSSARWKAA